MSSKTGSDLDAMTVQDLTSLIAAAEEKRTAKMAEAKALLLAEFKTRSAELGMSMSEMRGAPAAAPGRKPRSDAGIKAGPKYRSPDGATWSGRGRKPTWLHEAEAAGKAASEFLIDVGRPEV